eukprot:scaffold130248_cov22-Tisochrysis_lutea.AAC.3
MFAKPTSRRTSAAAPAAVSSKPKSLATFFDVRTATQESSKVAEGCAYSQPLRLLGTNLALQ